MTRTVVILQSNYLPWRGYFDLIRRCDLFILSDTVQYTKKDWRSLNLVKTPSGPRWLTIPIEHGPRGVFAIDEAIVADPRWATKHIEILRHNYRRAASFDETAPWLFALLESVSSDQSLSRINTRLIREIAARLNITTPIIHSTELVPRDTLHNLERDERTLALCETAGANRYLSGPAAQGYMDLSLFHARGIEVVWMDYSGYPSYPQLWGAFEPKISIVDLLLNAGSAAQSYFLPVPASTRSPAACSGTGNPPISTVAQ